MTTPRPYAPHREETNFELFAVGMCAKYGVPIPVIGDTYLAAMEKIRDLIERMDEIIEAKKE
jgi:hypothetical protein